MGKIGRKIGLGLVNHLFKGTRFFAVKRFLLRLSGIGVGENTRVVAPLFIGGAASLTIGENVWIGRNFNIEGNGSVAICSNVDIGPNVTIGTGGHEIGLPSRRAGEGITSCVEIGCGTWVGQNSLIVGNVCVGKGCVIAAGAVVIHDVPNDVMVAGVPAVVKKSLPIE